MPQHKKTKLRNQSQNFSRTYFSIFFKTRPLVEMVYTIQMFKQILPQLCQSCCLVEFYLSCPIKNISKGWDTGCRNFLYFFVSLAYLEIHEIFSFYFTVHFKIEEISIKLRSGDLGIPANPEDR